MIARYRALRCRSLALAGVRPFAEYRSVAAGRAQSGASRSRPKQLSPRSTCPKVVGWKTGETPTVPPGFRIQAMATGLMSPRTVYPLPQRRHPGRRRRSRRARSRSSGSRTRSSISSSAWPTAAARNGPTNRSSSLRDANGDGKPELKSVLLDHLNSPFGVALVGGDLYVAKPTRSCAIRSRRARRRSPRRGQKVIDLPAGPINHHWTKSLTASPDGSKLYAGVGSNSNAQERGPEAETDRAAIWEVDPKTGAHRLFASGLRNPNGPTFYPGSNSLWTVVNERDELGPNLVPDYLTSVRAGGFYGWPYSYYGQHVDPRVRPQRPGAGRQGDRARLCAELARRGARAGFLHRRELPADVPRRRVRRRARQLEPDELNGYKVVFIRFAGGKPVGKPVDFVTGFLDADGKARGRPVGVAVDRTGALMIADDVGNTVWRVSYSASAGTRAARDVNHRDRRRELMATRDDRPRGGHPQSTAKIGDSPDPPDADPVSDRLFHRDVRDRHCLSPEP